DGGLHGAEWVVDRVHEDAALGVDDQHAVAVAAFDEVGAAAGRRRMEVDRPQQRRLALDIGQGVALVPGVIAERDRVGAGGAEVGIVALGEAAAMAGILAVDHDKIEAVVADEAGQALAHAIAAGAAHHVAEKQQPHAAAVSKRRAPCSVTITSSGTSWGSRGMASSSWAA